MDLHYSERPKFVIRCHRGLGAILDYYDCYAVVTVGTREGLRVKTKSIEGVRARWCRVALGAHRRAAHALQAAAGCARIAGQCGPPPG